MKTLSIVGRIVAVLYTIIALMVCNFTLSLMSLGNRDPVHSNSIAVVLMVLLIFCGIVLFIQAYKRWFVDYLCLAVCMTLPIFIQKMTDGLTLLAPLTLLACLVIILALRACIEYGFFTGS